MGKVSEPKECQDQHDNEREYDKPLQTAIKHLEERRMLYLTGRKRIGMS